MCLFLFYFLINAQCDLTMTLHDLSQPPLSLSYSLSPSLRPGVFLSLSVPPPLPQL